MADQMVDIPGAAAGDDQADGTSQLLLNGADDAVYQGRRPVDRAGTHTFRRVLPYYVARVLQLQHGQLGRVAGQGPQPRLHTGADHAPKEDGSFFDYIKGRRRAQVHGNQGQRIMGAGPGAVHQPVPAHLLRVGHFHGKAQAAFLGDDQRGHTKDGVAALHHHLQHPGHHAGNDHAGEILQLPAQRFQALEQMDGIVRRIPGAVGIQLGSEPDPVGVGVRNLHAAEGHGGIADVNDQNHIRFLVFGAHPGGAVDGWPYYTGFPGPWQLFFRKNFGFLQKPGRCGILVVSYQKRRQLMDNLHGKCVLLGITGGIAAYKMANVASALRKLGADVEVIMTKNATQFITPITFETLTGHKCMVDTFDRDFKFEVTHISLAKKADVIYFFARRSIWKQIGFLFLYYSGLIGTLAMLKPWLVDLGYDMKEIGVMSGVAGTFVGFLSSFAGGMIVRRIGRFRARILFAVFVLIATLYFLGLSYVHPTTPMLYGGIFLLWGSYGMATIVVYTTAMDCVRPGREGTDFTIQTVITHLSGMLMAILSGRIADHTGYHGLFFFEASIALISLIYIVTVFRKDKNTI